MRYFENKSFTIKEIEDSFAIIDIATGGNVISSVYNTKNPKDTLFEIAKEFETEINKALFSYESRPIVLCNKENAAFVFSGFTASSGMYLIAIPNVSLRSVAFALNNELFGEVLTFGEFPEITRVSRKMREDAQRLKRWFDIFDLSFRPKTEKGSPVFHELLRSRILNISEFIGVDPRIVTVGQISESEKFDFGLFLAFVTVMLMLARKRSRDIIMISIGEDSHGIFVNVSFSFQGQNPRYDKEILAFRGMLDRKRVFFEAFERDGSILIQCSPIIEDWSLLGLKTPDGEETEFELT